MSMNTKEAIDFGEKHLKADNRGTEEPKAWKDPANVMMLKTDRSELVNVLKNYEEMSIEGYDRTLENVRNTTTVKATFTVDYMKDILKLMTKVKKDAETITIELGDNTAGILRLNDYNGVVLEIALDPRVEG